MARKRKIRIPIWEARADALWSTMTAFTKWRITQRIARFTTETAIRKKAARAIYLRYGLRWV
jgi:hypothetical protein